MATCDWWMPQKSPEWKENQEKKFYAESEAIVIFSHQFHVWYAQTLCTRIKQWKLVMSKQFTFEIPSVCLYIHTHTHTTTHTHVHARAHTHTHTPQHMRMHTHILHTIHKNTHTHTNTHTQHTTTHTQSRRRNWWGYQWILQKVIAKGLFKQLSFSAKFHLAQVCLKWVPEYIFKILSFFLNYCMKKASSTPLRLSAISFFKSVLSWTLSLSPEEARRWCVRLGGVEGERRLVMEGEETEFWAMRRGRCSPVTPAEELEEDDWSRSEMTCTTPVPQH